MGLKTSRIKVSTLRGARRHHNNKGSRGIKTGSYYNQLKKFAEKNGIPFGSLKNDKED